MSLIIKEFIGFNHIATMVAKKVRDTIPFGFGFMRTPWNGANKDLSFLLIGCWMRIQDMITEIGFTFVFFATMGAQERSIMSFQVIVHGTLKSLCFVTMRTYKMTSFVLDIFVHGGKFCYQRGKIVIQFYF